MSVCTCVRLCVRSCVCVRGSACMSWKNKFKVHKAIGDKGGAREKSDKLW